jgi:outer membrane protein TolC
MEVLVVMGKIYRPLLSKIFFFAAFFPVFAQEETRLTVDQAVELAVRQSVSLRKSAVDLESASYAAEHLWAEFFPSISASAGVSYGTNLFTNKGFIVDKNNFGYSFSTGISLTLNAGLPSALKIIGLAYQTQLLTYEDAKRRLAIQVKKAFYSLIAEKQNTALLQETFDLAQKQREKSRIAFRNGLVGERSDLQSELAVENARLNLAKAETGYASRLRAFLALLDMEKNEKKNIELIGEIAVSRITVDPDALIEKYLAKRPDMVKQKQTIERLSLSKKQQALSKRAPSVSASARWSASASGNSNSFTDTIRGELSVSVPLDPWIPGTKTHQALRSADAELEKATLDLKNLEKDAENEIRNLAENLDNLWKTIEMSRMQVRLAERAYRLTEQGFQQGAVEFLTLEDARASLESAKQQLLSGELAYKTGILDLEAAVNADLEVFNNE